MKRRSHVIVFLLVVALATGTLTGRARAESARSLVARGNSLYAADKFEEAKKAYQEAAGKDPESPEIQYDLGNALYRLKDFAGAAEAYQQATMKTRDPELISRSEFNLGNTAFRQGEAAEAKDPEKAIDSFQESIGHFRAALAQNEAFKEAGRNLQISKERLLTAREELKKRQAAAENERRKQEEMAKEAEKEKGDQTGGSKDQQAKKEESKSAQQGAPPGEKQHDAARAKGAEVKGAEAGKAQPVDQSAQELLNEEKENAIQRQQQQSTGVEPVDKDW